MNAEPRLLNRMADLAIRAKRHLALRSRLKHLIFCLTQKHKFGLTPIQNIYHDLRWGGFFGGLKPSQYAYLGAYRTQSTDYEQLHRLFKGNRITIKPTDVLVDVGCGKGRVINFWLSLGLKNRIVGLELDSEVAETTRKRLASYGNVTILSGDAIANLPSDGTLFYLFNPFDGAVMQRFKTRIALLRSGMDQTTIIYYNCRHLEVFENDPHWTIEPLDTGNHNTGALIRMSQEQPVTRGEVLARSVHSPVSAHGSLEQNFQPTVGDRPGRIRGS